MKRYNCDYLVIIHRLFIDRVPKKGGADVIVDYLLENKKRVGLVEHSLEGSGYSIFSIRDSSGTHVLKKIKIMPGKEPLRWISEFVLTLILVFKNFRYIPYCVAVDPLNALQSFALRGFKRVGKVYFHCIDYSEKRFKAPFLNFIYHGIYRFSLKRADLCGVAGRRMREMISPYLDKEKLFFIPNSPLYKEWQIDFAKRNRNALVIMSGRVDEKTNYKSVINILKRLRLDFPDIEFKIIAKIENKEYVRELEAYISKKGLNGRVSFLGFFPEPKDLGGILINCGVGITSYSFNKEGYHTEFGDSLKIREYAMYGLPIVADGVCDTAYEAEENKCGFVVNSEDEAEKTLRMLWENDNLYREYCRNAVLWAKKNDKRIILKNLMEKLTNV